MKLWNIYHEDIPVFLQKAMETPAMQRLQHIGMNCGCEYTQFPLFSMCEPYSRYDHSVGCALIVWHFTKDKAQSLAALFHDIATPTFAHVVDFAKGDYLQQESTESQTASLIRNSPELKALLDEYAISYEAVEDYHIYPIADNSSPKLCADRLEYTLGNAVNYQFLTPPQAREIFNDLHIGINEYGEEELIFHSPEIATIFAHTALQCGKVYVSDPDRYAMQILSEILADALISGVLCDDDLYTTEQIVIHKLSSRNCGHRWQTFCHLKEIIVAESPLTEEAWRCIPAKKRYIDPYIAHNGRTSVAFPEFRMLVEEFLSAPQTYWILGK